MRLKGILLLKNARGKVQGGPQKMQELDEYQTIKSVNYEFTRASTNLKNIQYCSAYDWRVVKCKYGTKSSPLWVKFDHLNLRKMATFASFTGHIVVTFDP